MKRIEDMNEPELRVLTSRVCSYIQHRLLPPHCAFAVTFWPIGNHNIAQYGSNCSRKDMIECLRTLADRLEKREDVPR